MWNGLRFHVHDLQDGWKVVLPVEISSVGVQNPLCCRDSSQATVEIQTFVDDPEQGCLVTGRHNGMARPHWEHALITNGSIEAPYSLV